MRYLSLILLYVGLTVSCPTAQGSQSPTTPYTKQEVEERSRSIARQVAYDIENGRLAPRLDEALHNLVKMGVWHLKDRGHNHIAMRSWFEFNERYINYFEVAFQGHEIPDKYPPLSEWLRNFYNTLEFILGEPAMRTTRLFDIKVINNCIPVTFCLFGIEESIDLTQYEPYFVALSGTITYWVANGICIGATWGTGAFWLCSPIAWGAENLMEKFLAPRIVSPSFNLFCKE